MLVGARGMGVGDERKLHHGEDEAEAEDEEQHNDAAGLPAANGRPNIVGRTDRQTDRRELPLKGLSTAARAFSVATSPPRKLGLTTIRSAVGYNVLLYMARNTPPCSPRAR